MNLFSSLPEDIQREVCYFLDKEELTKLSSNIFKNQDVFWKEKLSRTYYRDFKSLDFKNLYEREYYKNLLKGGFTDDLACKLVDDEDFLENHIDIVTKGDTLLSYICNDKSKEKEIQKLILKGANVNHMVSNKGPILTIACAFQKLSIVKLLLDAGANVNYYNPPGLNSLSLFYSVYINDIEKVKLLLDYGLVVNPGSSQNALLHAEQKGYYDIANLLKSKM
jgi:ankyrin repeat protein